MVRMFPTIHDRVFAGENIDQRGNLVSQLILSDLFHISFVPNLLLILAAEVQRLHINRNFLNRSSKLIVPFFVIIPTSTPSSAEYA